MLQDELQESRCAHEATRQQAQLAEMRFREQLEATDEDQAATKKNHFEQLELLQAECADNARCISQLRMELNQLHDDCRRKDMQIGEADTMRKNLIAAIGLPQHNQSVAEHQEDESPFTLHVSSVPKLCY